MNRKHSIKGSQTERPCVTRQRILDAAERLFAKHGIDAVSVRDITGAAGANLGAVNYHFGGKDKLVAAVFDRRMAPLMEERLRRLALAEASAGNKPPKLDAVLDAMFRPSVEHAMSPRHGGALIGKLMARSMVDPNPVVEKTLGRHIEPVARRFDQALGRVMPGLTAEDIFWRMHLLIGALHQSLLMMDRKLPNGRTVRMDAESFSKRFLAFACAAFTAKIPGV